MGCMTSSDPRKELLRKYRKRLTFREEKYLEIIFNDLAFRSPNQTIDKRTFLTYFHLPKIMVDKVFKVFDMESKNVINKEGFFQGMAYFCKAEKGEILWNIFKLFDLRSDDKIAQEELLSILKMFPRITHNIIIAKSDNKVNKDLSLATEELKFSHNSFQDETEYQTKYYSDDDHREVCKLIFDNYSFDGKSLDFEEFKDLFDKNIDILKIFENVFSSSRWKLIDKAAQSNYNYKNDWCKCMNPSSSENEELRDLASIKDYSVKEKNNSGEIDQQRKVIQESNVIAEDLYSKGNFYKLQAVLFADSIAIYRKQLKHDLVKYIQLSGVKYSCKDNCRIKKLKNDNDEFMKDQQNENIFLEKTQDARHHRIHPENKKHLSKIMEEEDELIVSAIIFESDFKDYKPAIQFDDPELQEKWKVKLNELNMSQMNNPIAMDNLDIMGQIGWGAQGNVQKARLKDKDQIQALKIMDKSKLDDVALDAIHNELSIHRTISHKNIVKYYLSFENDEFIQILMDFLKGDDLRTILNKRVALTDKTITAILIQLSNALAYLHSNHIVHRDLKPENIFISEGQIVKLIDFGLATIDLTGNLMEACGSIIQIAPEVQLQEGYSCLVDIWALGVIGMETIAGGTPWDDLSDNDAIRSIVEDPVDFKLDRKSSKDLVKILMHCTNKNKSDRWTALQVQNALETFQYGHDMGKVIKFSLKDNTPSKKQRINSSMAHIDRSKLLKSENIKGSISMQKGTLRKNTLVNNNDEMDKINQMISLKKSNTIEVNLKDLNKRSLSEQNNADKLVI